MAGPTHTLFPALVISEIDNGVTALRLLMPIRMGSLDEAIAQPVDLF